MSFRTEPAGVVSGPPQYSRSVEERLWRRVNATADRPDVDSLALFGIAFEGVVISLAVLLNALLAVGMARSPRLQAPIFQLVLSVAIADLLLAASASPRVYDYFALDDEWIFGRAGCAIFTFLDYLLPQVTGSLLLACCWERFYAVCRPASAHCASPKRFVVIIILIWIASTGVCAALLVRTAIGQVRFSDGTVIPTCVVTLNDSVIKLFDTATALVFFFLASITSMMFLFVTVSKAVKASCDYVKDDFKNHVLRCIFIVTTLHLLLWLPQRVMRLYNWHAAPANTITNPAILRIARQLVYVSSAVKPVIYVATSSRFRGALFRSLRCCESTGEPRYQLAASTCTSSAKTELTTTTAVSLPSASAAAGTGASVSERAALTEADGAALNEADGAASTVAAEEAYCC